jgi:multicomponent Na+:H+ antiporter subunit B
LKGLLFLVVGLFMALLLYAETDLPDRGDPSAPASTHVAADYIERSMEDTNTPNAVTAVLADYRGWDTLGEAVVVFTAALCCVLILMSGARDEQKV